MPAGFEVPVIIVGFGHSDDIVKCLNAIATQRRCPKFEVFICENGGPVAFDALVKTLTEKGAPTRVYNGFVSRRDAPHDLDAR